MTFTHALYTPLYTVKRKGRAKSATMVTAPPFCHSFPWLNAANYPTHQSETEPRRVAAVLFPPKAHTFRSHSRSNTLRVDHRPPRAAAAAREQLHHEHNEQRNGWARPGSERACRAKMGTGSAAQRRCLYLFSRGFALGESGYRHVLGLRPATRASPHFRGNAPSTKGEFRGHLGTRVPRGQNPW